MSNTPPMPPTPQGPTQPKPTDPKEGRYKAKAATPDGAGAPHEFGKSSQGTPELLVHLFLADLQKTYVSPLYFSREAAPYSEERLKALGCTDIATLAGIDTNEVDVELKYDWYDGSWHLKCQILSGGGVFHSSNPIASGKEFAAQVALLTGRAPLTGGPGNGAPPAGQKPPF